MLRQFQPRLPLLLLGAFLALLLAGWLMPVSIVDLWHWGSALAGHPAAILGIVLIMILLMSFGLPGSMCFWLIAPFHAPWLSVSMLLVGSVGGALGAWLLGRKLGQAWRPGKLARQVLRLLGKRSGFFSQCALRILPGFPHAFINFAAGVLRLPLPTYLLAACLGLGIKWSVYAQAVHGMVSATRAESALGLATMAPLIVLAALMAAGGFARRYWMNTSQGTPETCTSNPAEEQRSTEPETRPETTSKTDY